MHRNPQLWQLLCGCLVSFGHADLRHFVCRKVARGARCLALRQQQGSHDWAPRCRHRAVLPTVVPRPLPGGLPLLPLLAGHHDLRVPHRQDQAAGAAAAGLAEAVHGGVVRGALVARAEAGLLRRAALAREAAVARAAALAREAAVAREAADREARDPPAVHQRPLGHVRSVRPFAPEGHQRLHVRHARALRPRGGRPRAGEGGQGRRQPRAGPGGAGAAAARRLARRGRPEGGPAARPGARRGDEGLLAVP
mmetsp:Transcript_415/g.1264  ORF Transcript_415/g.1264 Transcript_415/m.1264 type:complete len:252 (-) Transcript_415:288-1043(-)